ncbi:hypothetical protein G9A89_001688 [Geosiphon pyriformis]|nr:hypothetical protein G9A89_001688 [Geosiphon pyriformis]
MTDFGLSDGYNIHDGLDQSEHLRRYHVNFKFVVKMGRVESMDGMTSYLAAGAFIDDMIWIENCQASTQYALNIASEFFKINDISINNDKTVVISINQGVKVASLSICDQPISIAKKSKAHCYVDIFLSMKGLSKSSVFKAHFDPIVSYQTQFSFVSSGVCCKWDVMVRKGLKSKAGLSYDFLDAVLHHSFLYGLKTFEQVQSERKIAALVSFFNASEVLGCLFDHRFLDLQFSVKLHVSLVNNFLAGIVKIFLSNELSLANNLPNAFCSPDHFPLLLILGSSEYFNSVCSLKCFGDKRGCVLDWKTFHCWKKLDPRGPMPFWFSVGFSASSSAGFAQFVNTNVLDSEVFSLVKDELYDGSLRNAGSVDTACDVAAYFLVLDRNIGVVVGGLLFSTLAELQAVMLALECVPSSCQVILHTDSQAAIDVCLSELSCTMSDFHNWYWLERCHIFNLVRKKDLEVTDLVAGNAAQSPFSLLTGVYEHYLVAENTAISGNAHHFEAGLGVGVISVDFIGCVNWISTAKVWHSNSHMLTEFTGRKTSNLHSYLIKAVHRHLPVAVRKRLYDKGYPGILCLLCSEVEFSDHAFTCSRDVVIHDEVLVKTSAHWVLVVGLCDSLFSAVLWTLSACSLDVSLYSIVYKSFVLDEWYEEAQSVFENKKQTIGEVVSFVRFVADLYCVKAWLVRSEHKVWMEKTGLVADSEVVSDLSRDVSSILSGEVIRILGVVELFTVSFGHHLLCCFFSGLDSVVNINIGV